MSDQRERRGRPPRPPRPARPVTPDRPQRGVITDLGGGPSSSRAEGGESRGAEPGPQLARPRNGLYISTGIVGQMELRTESSFRPYQPDFESIYALTGEDSLTIDTLHSFASGSVVQDARPETVTPIVDEIIRQIAVERREQRPAQVAVIVHTHPAPGNIAEPSTNDLRFFENAEKTMSDALNGCQFYFAVHAMSGDHLRSREPLAQSMGHRLRWVSIYREHEVSFFDAQGLPKEVTIDEQR